MTTPQVPPRLLGELPVHQSRATNPVGLQGRVSPTPTVAVAGRCRCRRCGEQPNDVTVRHVESLDRAVTHLNAEQRSRTA